MAVVAAPAGRGYERGFTLKTISRRLGNGLAAQRAALHWRRQVYVDPRQQRRPGAIVPRSTI